MKYRLKKDTPQSRAGEVYTLTIENGRDFLLHHNEPDATYGLFMDTIIDFNSWFEPLSPHEDVEEPRTLDDVRKGDVVVSADGKERMVFARLEDIVFLSVAGEYSRSAAYWTIAELKENGYTLKSPTPTKWEPKEGEEVWLVSFGELQTLPYGYKNMYRTEFEEGRIYPTRQQAQEALDAVLRVLADKKKEAGL